MGNIFLTLREAQHSLELNYPDRRVPTYETIRQAILSGKLQCAILAGRGKTMYIIDYALLYKWYLSWEPWKRKK